MTDELNLFGAAYKVYFQSKACAAWKLLFFSSVRPRGLSRWCKKHLTSSAVGGAAKQRENIGVLREKSRTAPASGRSQTLGCRDRGESKRTLYVEMMTARQDPAPRTVNRFQVPHP